MAQAGSVVNPSGWTRFFTELSSFIISSERQYGLANEQYTDYAIERFSLSCQSVEAFIGPIRTAGAELNSICSYWKICVTSYNCGGSTLTLLISDTPEVAMYPPQRHLSQDEVDQDSRFQGSN